MNSLPRVLLGTMLGLGVLAASTHAAVDDAIGYWRLNETNGTSTAADSSGNNYAGTLQNSAVWQTNGVQNGCLKFATNDSVTVSHAAAFDLTNQLAVSLWVKPAAPGAAGPSFSPLIRKGDPYLSGWGLLLTTNSTVLFQMTGSNGNSIVSADVLPTNRWTHVAVSVSNSTIRLYLNGLLDRQDTWTGTRSVNGSGLSIGGSGSTNSLSGALDQIRVFNHPLTDREAMVLFYEHDRDVDRLVDANETLAGTSATTADTDGDGYLDGVEIRAGTDPSSTNSYPALSSNLAGQWKHNEGTGTTTADSSGNSNTGDFENGTAWNTSGITSNSVTFDGNNDRINYGAGTTGSSLAVTNPTISFWAYVTNRNQTAGILDRAVFNSGVVDKGYFVLWDNANTRITPMFDSSPTVPIDLDDVINSDSSKTNWMHFAFTYNGSQIKSYLNGALYATGTYSADIDKAAQRLMIANPNDGPYQSDKYAGRFDEFRIYSQALSAGNIVALAEADGDNDGLPDRFERAIGTDPLKSDTDGDGMPDGWEVKYSCLNPLSNDASSDAESDGTSNYNEYLAGTNPCLAPPTATVSPSATICAGSSTNIQAVLTGMSPWTVAWSDQVTNTVSSSPLIRSVSPTSTTTYTVTNVTDATTQSSIGTGSAVITVKALPTATVSGSTAICAGGSANIQAALTGTGAWTVVWSDSFTTNVTSGPLIRSVSPGSTTTYTVTLVTDSTTCSKVGTGSAVITVHPLPTATVSGNATICAGVSTNIQATLTGTSPWTVVWSDQVTNNVASSPATRSVSPGSTTTYTVTKVTDATACFKVGTGSAVIIVNPLPTATVSGSATICAGGSVNIEAALTGTGPWTVAWSDHVTNNAVASSPASRSVSPSSTTTYTVTTVSDATTCSKAGTGSAVITVNALPNPAITAASPVCANSTNNVAFVAGAGGGAAYVWSIVNGTIDSGQNTTSIIWSASSISPVTLGIVITNSVGCINSNSVQVTVNDLPACSIDGLCMVMAQSTNVYAAPGGSGVLYAWAISGDGIIVGSTSNQMASVGAGSSGSFNLSLTTTGSNGCVSACSQNVTNVDYVIPTDLIAWWELNEGTNTLAVDSSGNCHDGLLIGSPAPAWISGIVSNALAFSGTGSNYVSVAGEGSLNALTNELTIAMWVTNAASATGTLISRYDTNTVAGSFNLSVTNGLAKFELNLSGTSTVLTASTAIPDNNWHHIAAVYDGTGMKLYLDGYTNAVNTATGSVVVVGADVLLGRHATGNAFSGGVDDARIYRTALGEFEVLALFSPGPDSDEDGIPDALDPDDDNDGMPDTWENQYGLNPQDSTDAILDGDSDGVNNLREYRQGRDPTSGSVADTGTLLNLKIFTPLE